MNVKFEPYRCYKCYEPIYPIERRRLGFPLRKVNCGGVGVGWACNNCDIEPQELPEGIDEICRQIWEHTLIAFMNSFNFKMENI
jgi:Zn-finger protein